MSLQLDPARRKVVSEQRTLAAQQALHAHYTVPRKHQYAVRAEPPPGVLLWRSEGTPAESAVRRDTSLVHAARRGDLNEIRVLLELGPIGIVPDRHRQKANMLLNARDFQGYAPLHWAAENGLVPVAKTLLDAGAAPSPEDVRRSTPLHLAVRHGFYELVELLVQRGADPASRDIAGRSSVDWSRSAQQATRNILRLVPKDRVRPDEACAHFFENRRRVRQQDEVVLERDDRVFAQCREAGAWWPAKVLEVREDSMDLCFRDSQVTMFLIEDAPGILDEIKRKEEEERDRKSVV